MFKKWNANLFEKIILTSTITLSVFYTLYKAFSRNSGEKKMDIFKFRQDLLKQKNVKMLYSTMSFFYLVGFRSQNPNDFITIHNILKAESPQLVVLPISQEENYQKYYKARCHPKFRDAMDAFTYSLQTKNIEEILKPKDFVLKNLEMLYLIDKCSLNPKCKVIYARKESKIYQKIDAQFQKLPIEKQKNAMTGNKAKIQDYTDILIAEMKPTMSFGILSPESPFKNIVGIVEPQLIEGVAQRWKDKFKQAYSHIIQEDTQTEAQPAK